MSAVTVIGAGLAGAEAAWQLLTAGFAVTLVEMRPGVTTPAHRTDLFAELVCSNSLKGVELQHAPGLLKAEMRRLDSLVLWAADRTAVPAGAALAVDRRAFARAVTARLRLHPRLTVRHACVTALPAPAAGPTVLATGPLTADALAADLARRAGVDALAFYDAIAPVVAGDSIDRGMAFAAGRHGRDDDYLNCPLSEAEYDRLVLELRGAACAPHRAFEEPAYFDACMPIEVMAARGRLVPAHGPMRPRGIVDPRTGREPFAVVQLRREDSAGRSYNLVGFQTRLKYGEQERVLRLIPGLAAAEFLRYGSVHRNTYINAPRLVDATLRLRCAPHVRVAGQLAGVEGYVESAALGLLVGRALARELGAGSPGEPPPRTTALGALWQHVVSGNPDNYQPSHVHWGQLPAASGRTKVDERRNVARRALADLARWVEYTAGSAVPAPGRPVPWDGGGAPRPS